MQALAGLEMDIYRMTRKSFPEQSGYDEILHSLGDQSRIYKLKQGRYYWDTADLALIDHFLTTGRNKSGN
jgi:hypothetical protein